MRLLAPPLIATLVVAGLPPGAASPPEAPRPRRARLVHFECTVLNDTAETLRDLRCDLLLPEDGPGQRVDGVRLSAHDWVLARDAEDQWAASAEVAALAPDERTTFAWLAAVELFPAQAAGETTEGAALDATLASDRTIELESPAVVAAARAVRARVGPGPPSALVWSARDLVRERVRYELAGGWRPAAEVLETETGSCSETTFAFVAICRRLGIPARWIGGTVDRGAGRGRGSALDRTFHRQAEVHLPGRGWVRVETTPGPRSDDPGRLDDGPAAMLVLSRAASDRGAAGLYYHARMGWSAPRGSGARPRIRKHATWTVDARRQRGADRASRRQLAHAVVRVADAAGYGPPVEDGWTGTLTPRRGRTDRR